MTTTTLREPKAPKPLESEVQDACKSILEAYGWRVERRNTGAMSGSHKGKRWFVRFGRPGAADLFGSIGILDGKHFECEVKRRGERPTLEQVKFLLEAHANGVVAFWVDSPEKAEQVALRVRHVASHGGPIIRYLGTTRKYPVTGKDGKKIGDVEGPSGDYELI